MRLGGKRPPPSIFFVYHDRARRSWFPARDDSVRRLDAILGYALLRLTFGVNFLFHSYQRWANLGGFVEDTARDFTHTPLPEWSVQAFAATIPFFEPVLGLLLVLGLWTRTALVAGALFVVALTFGTALRSDFNALTAQGLYALTFFVLLLFRADHDRLSLDGWRRGTWTRR